MSSLIQLPDQPVLSPEISEEEEVANIDQERELEANVTMSIVSDQILPDITPRIKESKKWKILVYGVNDLNTDEVDDHHMSLLGGIIGEQISPDKKSQPSFSFEKNGVTTIIHVGSHSQCITSYEDVHLLLFFIPVHKYGIDELHIAQIDKITREKGVLIWKHSSIILTGTDKIVKYNKKRGHNASERLDSLLNQWKSKIRRTLTSAIGEGEGVTCEDVLVQLAGKQEQLDLPKPLEKWFSQLWYGCFFSSKLKAMPAILKLALRRISNSVTSEEIQQRQFCQQPIQAKIEPLGIQARLSAGIQARLSAIGINTYKTYAIIGALFAVGLVLFNPFFLFALVIVFGIAIFYIARQTNKIQQPVESKTSELKQFYTELITLIPSTHVLLTEWAKKQVTCKIVVAGMEGEGVSTVAAALTGQVPNDDGTRLYKQQDDSLVVYDFQGFPKMANKQLKARELVDFQKQIGSHLLIFCIPMTLLREKFVFSEHAKYLERLCEIDSTILSNTVIALTHANELRTEFKKQNAQLQTSFQQFFTNETNKWIKHIKMILVEYIHNENNIADVPVIPVGNAEASIDLFSEDENCSPDTQYYWLSSLLLHAMPATKPEGLPTLIKANRKRIGERLEEYPDIDKTRALLVDAQCSMFSKIGLRERSHQGEAIGLMLGVNDEQKW